MRANSLYTLQRSFWEIILFALLWTVVPYRAFAQEVEPEREAEQKILEIRSEISQVEGEIPVLQAKVEQLNSTITVLRGEIEQLKREGAQIKEELENVAREKLQKEHEIVATRDRVERIRKVSVARIRAAYVNRREAVVDLLLTSSKRDTFSFTSVYLAKVRQFDQGNLASLRSFSEALSSQLYSLSIVIQERDLLLVKNGEKTALLNQKILKQSALAREVKAEQKLLNDTALALKAKLLRFETVMASITGGSPAVEVGPKNSADLRKKAEIPHIVTFDGEGLVAGATLVPFKGEGRIVVKFGEKVQTKTGVAGKSKGIDLLVSNTNEILSVAGGKVAFVGELPVLGKVVIIEHGKRWYSLYGRLVSVTTERGALVERGAVIGTISDPEPEKGNFYFEVRSAGDPIDVLSRFKLLFS